VSFHLSRRGVFGAAVLAAFVGARKVFGALGPGYITPETFGAVGDGKTNDTAAFAAMSHFVNQNGGGTVVLRPTTYLVGAQQMLHQSIYSFSPSRIMEFSGCSESLAIIGNGARLRCADHLRYGTFSRAGQATFHSLPYLTVGELATPYVAMIKVVRCTGGVEISDLELDGNMAGLFIGGAFGDTGRQIPADGLQLLDNCCSEQVHGVYSHHHARDGLLISGQVHRNSSSSINKLRSEYNARQGCSITGGCNYDLSDCRFNHTGKAALVSAPGAGVDIEAEDKTIRNLSFYRCEFSNNTGPGMIADSGDTDAALFETCRFVGTTNWSAWPKKPHFRFVSCQFVGSICSAFGDPDPHRAVQFFKCEFLDDPSLSPTGNVYSPLQPIADLNVSRNVLFDSCRFNLTGQTVLPWTLNVIYHNCRMSQVQVKQSYPRGTFTGSNRITGNVDLYGSKILGDLTVNGKLLRRTA
jgi:hypothetical protein